MICLRMGKTYTTKTSLSDFKVTTPENSILSKQAVTSKGILVPYTNLQLTLTPIYNWTCSVVTISPFQCTAPSTWLTNQCANPSTWLDHQLKKDVGCKVLQFITRWRSWAPWSLNPKVYKHSSFFFFSLSRPISSRFG